MNYSKVLEEKITVKDTLDVKLKDTFNKLLTKLVKGFRSSKDKTQFPKGVNIDMKINVKKDRFDQVVVNNKTGRVVHEEHMSLTDHNLGKRN